MADYPTDKRIRIVILPKPISTEEYKALIKTFLDRIESDNTSESDIRITNHEAHAELLNFMHEQYVAKNTDYGNSFSETFERFGLTAPIVRMWDKLQRVETLSKQDARVKDEGIRDTLLDLANYAIMSVIELDKRKS
jgi:hypothetical protein